jgi:hypothetical protein
MATSSISVGSLSVSSLEAAFLLAKSYFDEVASDLTSLVGAGDDSGATAGVAEESEP